MYQRILVPLDGSELAEKAVEHAVVLAKAFSSQVYLVQVVVASVSSLTPYDIDYQLNESAREAAIQNTHEYLNTVANRLQAQQISSVNVKVIEGVVVDSILDYAQHMGIDLIVMATHGRSGVSRWVFGSVAERVLRASPCPVFLVRVSNADDAR